ncbi:MAG: hypothetical protein M3451_11345, partial [Chloroflexota bacterium]|nr:hypothetical protein [Chloroflexota bacterium]
LQTRLLTVMREQFDHEQNRSISRIDEAVAPYTRFVRSSQDEMQRMRGDLGGIRNELASLRHRIEGPQVENREPPEPIALPERTARDA